MPKLWKREKNNHFKHHLEFSDLIKKKDFLHHLMTSATDIVFRKVTDYYVLEI